MSSSNLVHELFPDPNKRAVVMEPVCWDLELHIWRLLLNAISTQTSLDLFYSSAVGFQDKRPRMNRSFLLNNSKFANQTVAVTGETPGIITYDFPPNDKYIMRAVLANSTRLNRDTMLASLDKQQVIKPIQNELVPLIESQDQDWFASVFVAMLPYAGVGLSVAERTQLMDNLIWFRQNFR